MTKAVCFKCGEIKFGALAQCKKCEAMPKSDDELMLSLGLSDHHFNLEQLQELGQDIKRGIVPELSEQSKKNLLPELQKAKMMIEEKLRAILKKHC